MADIWIDNFMRSLRSTRCWKRLSKNSSRPTRAARTTTVTAQLSLPCFKTWSTKIDAKAAAAVVGTTSATPAIAA